MQKKWRNFVSPNNMNTRTMRKYILFLLTVMVVPMLFISCADNEETVEYSEDCYIQSFSLGQLKRRIYGVTAEGMDSIYTTSFSGSSFIMSIDQRNLTIENMDSLPIRTQVDKVLATIGFEGLLVWRKADITNAEDTIWNTYSTTDSIDFSEPLHFRVYSASGLSHRTYKVKVNIHQQQGDSTVWDSIGRVESLSGMGARKAVEWNGQMVVLAENGGKLTYLQHPKAAMGDWVAVTTTGTEGAMPETLQKQGSRLYVNTTEGVVLESKNAVDWVVAPHQAMQGLQLVAASDDYLYALAEGRLYRSNGGEWTEEQLDDDASLLPLVQINSAYYSLNNGMPRLILVGAQNETDSVATVWAKSWEKGAEDQAEWIYYTPNQADEYRLPMFSNLCIVPYDNGLQAFGGRAPKDDRAAMEVILHSQDHGITWKTYVNNDMQVDSRLQEDAQTAQCITAVADSDNFLWIFADDKVWRGRINRLGFKRKDI